MDWEDLYKKAYELAYLIVTEHSVARRVTKISLFKLEPTIIQQDRRRYYQPRRLNNVEFEDQDILEPYELGWAVLNGADPISKYLRDNGFLRRATIQAVDSFGKNNDPKTRQALREKLADNLNDAILRGRLREVLSSTEKPFAAADSRPAVQTENRLLIQQTYEKFLVAVNHRNFVNLTDTQILQLLVYRIIEPYERSNESEGRATNQDLWVRYLKHLAKTSFSANGFHTSVAYGSLIYDYGRAGSKKIFQFTIQDPLRNKPESNYSSLKSRLIKGLEHDRFADKYRLLKIEAPGVNTNFQRIAVPPEQKGHVIDWLKQLALWRRCITSETEIYSSKTIAALFTFSGVHADDEHPIERRRIHAISCPNCFGLIASHAGIEKTVDHLKLPVFESSVPINNDGDGLNHRQAPALDFAELAEDLKELQDLRALRRAIIPDYFSIRIDGLERLKVSLTEPSKETVIDCEKCYETTEVWAVEKNGAEALLGVKFFELDAGFDRIQVIELNLLHNNSLVLEFGRPKEGKILVSALLLPGAIYEVAPLENCISAERLRVLSMKKSEEMSFETLHLRSCFNCRQTSEQIREELHPDLLTLLAYQFETGNLIQANGIERHLATGCELCARVLRAISLQSVTAKLSAGKVLLEPWKRFRNLCLAALETVPLPISLYKSESFGDEIPFFALIEQGEIVISIEETEEEEWLVTVSTLSTDFKYKNYFIELVGDTDHLVEEIDFRKRGDYYEGSAYFKLNAEFRSRNRIVLVFGCPSANEIDLTTGPMISPEELEGSK